MSVIMEIFSKCRAEVDAKAAAQNVAQQGKLKDAEYAQSLADLQCASFGLAAIAAKHKAAIEEKEFRRENELRRRKAKDSAEEFERICLRHEELMADRNKPGQWSDCGPDSKQDLRKLYQDT